MLSMRLAFIIAIASCAACSPGIDPEMQRTISAHDAALRDMPQKFYEPGLGDQMHSLQLRHAKLWFAGTHENWDLAAFELHEIGESLDRVARWNGDAEDIAMAPALKAFMQDGRYALDQSIRRQNTTEFAAAFDRLTDGCNGCHRAARHGFIVIRRPVGDPVGNQEWAAAPEGAPLR